MLTWFIALFTVGRLIIGVLLRKIPGGKLLSISAIIALVGCVIIALTSSLTGSITALTLAGLGLAAGFPVVLGGIGDRYPTRSGTAFGLALTIALLGNMFINYVTGIVTETKGIESYSWMLIGTACCCTVLILFTFYRNKIRNNENVSKTMA